MSVTLVEVEGVAGSPSNILRGTPTTVLNNQYTDKTEQYFAGKWSSTVGCWEFEQVGEEFCHMISGKAKLTDSKGSNTYKAGDTFVIPHGFKGTWETLEPLQKIYVSWVPKSKL
jgi:uncharacterized protein